MNLHMTGCAVSVLRVQVMLRASRLLCAHAVILTMAFQTELRNLAGPEQPRIGRAVRRVAGNTAFGLDGSVFKGEGTLLICMTLDARCIGTGRQSCLL